MRILALANEGDLKWCRDAVSGLTLRNQWADCQMDCCHLLQDWHKLTTDVGIADLLICDITIPGALEELKLVRRRNTAALVVPIASSAISPSAYVCPDILPFALLWHPIASDDSLNLLYRVLSKIYFDQHGQDSSQFLSIHGKRETRQVPYGEICYFEARNKRVYARLWEQEIPVNETITTLETQLPEQFFRCHKSFLVNQFMVEAVDWSKMVIRLRGNLLVPVSRGFRAVVKERFHGTL